MSMHALPTELDVRILGYLGTQAKSCMTRVSKYYREIAEPLLYENIFIWAHDDHRVKLLLITLLRRQDLRQLVKWFELRHDSHALEPRTSLPKLDDTIFLPNSPDGSMICNLLWLYVEEVKKALDHLTSQYRINPQYRMIWFTKVFEPFPLFDGAVALLLCLLPNITGIRLELSSNHPLPLTQRLFGYFDWEILEKDDPDRPFRRLEMLQLRGIGYQLCAYDVTIQPGLQALSLRGNRKCHLTVPAKPPRDTNVLQSLYFKDVHIDPRLLENTIRSSWLLNLKSLRIYGVGRENYGWPSDDLWHSFNFSRLKQAMLIYLPRLENFTLMDMKYIYRWHEKLVPFGSFAAFPQLKNLGLDYNLFVAAEVGHSQQDVLPDTSILPHYFPPQLEFFHLNEIGWQLINLGYTKYHYLEISGAQFNALEAFQGLLALLPMKDIRATVSMRGWLQSRKIDTQSLRIDEPAIHLLRSTADTLHSQGTTLRIDYYMNNAGESPRMLVQPGFTAKEIYYDTDEDA